MKLKKVLAIVLCATMALSVSACGSKKTKEETTKEAAEAGSKGTIELADYKTVVAYEAEAEVTDETIDSTVNNLVSSYATTKQKTKGKVKEGDSINIDYVGKMDGVAFEGGTASGVDITVGSSGYIDGFDDGLVGVAIGDTVDLNLQFPDPYENNPDYAGKDCVFTVTVNYKSVTKTPELTDDFVKENIEKYYGVSTVDDLKAFIGEKLKLSQITNAIWQDYVEACEVKEYDQGDIDDAVKNMEDYYESMYESAYSVDVDTYLEAMSINKDDWENDLTEDAKKEIKEKMVVYNLAEKENLITDETYEKTGLVYCQSYKAESIDDLKEKYGEEQVDYVIKYTIVTEWLASNVEILEGERPTEADTETGSENVTEAETEIESDTVEATETEGETVEE